MLIRRCVLCSTNTFDNARVVSFLEPFQKYVLFYKNSKHSQTGGVLSFDVSLVTHTHTQN